MLTRGREGGQALVEFALVAPIFLLILFGIIQLGLLFAGQNGLTSAVRETARYAAPYLVVDSTGAQTTCATVAQSLVDLLGGNPLTADPSSNRTFPLVTYSTLTDPSGNSYLEVTVKAEYKFPLYVPLVGNFLDGMDGVSDSNLRISAQEEMRVENDTTGITTAGFPVSCS